MSDPPTSPGARTRARLLGLARVTLGLAILAFVATHIAWRDELLWVPADGKPLVVPGTLEGDWKEDAIVFQAAPGTRAGAGWPEDAAARIAEGADLAVERRPSGKGAVGFDWRPGLPHVFGDVELGGLLLGGALIFLGAALSILRWNRLLAVAGCPTSLLATARLSLLGYFFNLVVPGLTGGDIVKGVLVARDNPRRRADALVSIVVDRVMGLVALMALTAVTIQLAPPQLADLRAPILLLVAGVFAGAVVYANPFLRERLRVEAVLRKLPFGDKLQALDRAGVIYLRHRRDLAYAFLLSLGNHCCLVLGVYVFGRAFGVEADSVSLSRFFVVVPVANIISAIPVAPGGWGVGEAVYKWLFERIGASGALGVAVSVSFRLTQLALGLLGGVYMLLPSGRRAVREAEAAGAAGAGAP